VPTIIINNLQQLGGNLQPEIQPETLSARTQKAGSFDSKTPLRHCILTLTAGYRPSVDRSIAGCIGVSRTKSGES
jgi:hypothetical protein